LSIIKKIPKLKTIAPVYAVIVVMLYYPTIIRFFWKTPSWLLFSPLGDLFSIYCYMVAINFLESLLVLLGVLVLCVILPKKWFYDYFISKGILLTVLTLAFFMYLGNKMQPEMPFPWGLVRQTPWFILLIILLVFILDQIAFLRKFLEATANRFVVFLYILIPISILAAIVVLVRNIS
jgi:hypothetical protein